VFLRTLEALLDMSGGPISATAVGYAMDISLPTWSHYRDELIKFGMITRTGGGKRSSLQITDKGRAYLANAR
jgi:predicted transcriptional regulator